MWVNRSISWGISVQGENSYPTSPSNLNWSLKRFESPYDTGVRSGRRQCATVAAWYPNASVTARCTKAVASGASVVNCGKQDSGQDEIHFFE